MTQHIIDTDELERLPTTWIEGQYYFNKYDIYALIGDSPQVPEGCTIVPIEPTVIMKGAGAESLDIRPSEAEAVYKAMLSAKDK